MARKFVDNASMFLTAVGGINWGLIGLGNFFGSNWNLVNMALGGMPIVENVVYVLVGAGAVNLGYKAIMK